MTLNLDGEIQDNLPQFMTLDEVALRIKVTKRTIQRYIKREDNPLPVVYFTDNTPRVPWDQFEVWIKSMEDPRMGDM